MLPTENLKAYYPFEGNANDASGNGNNGTVYGATLASGKFGQCYSFDGENDYIDFGNFIPVSGTTARTVTAWIKTSTAVQIQTIVEWGTDALGERFTFKVDVGDGTLRVEVSGDGESGTTDVTDGNWHFAAVTYDGGGNLDGCKIWLDGKLELDVTNTYSLDTGTDVGLNIGRDGVIIESRYFVGTIDEVAIWEKELSQSDIKRVMLGMHPLDG